MTVAFVVFALAGCASEGGVVGSGISSSVSGNVAAVEIEGSSPETVPSLPAGLRVGIDEVEGLEVGVGADGTFELEGELEGEITVRFAVADRVLARLPLDVPAGSAIVVEDVELRPDLPGGIRTGAVRQRAFFGRVAFVDCAEGFLLIDDERRRPFQITVAADTEVVRFDGRAAACDDIRRGDRVLIEGLVTPDRLVEASRIVIGARRGRR